MIEEKTFDRAPIGLCTGLGICVKYE